MHITHPLRYQVVSSTKDDVKWASSLITQVYKGHDVIPVEVMLDWYRANPNGFFVVKRSDGANVGNLDLLTFRPDTLQQFIGGGILERNISGDCLYKPNEKSFVRDVYIASLVVPESSFARESSNAASLRAVIRKLPHCIRKVCDKGSVERGEINIYALSASPNITRLMVENGFKIVSSKIQRKDAHDLYRLDFKSLESEVMGRTKGRGAGLSVS
jgi:hypothetical protein